MKHSCLFYSNLVPHFYIVSQKRPRSRNITEICKKNADGYLKKLAKINRLAVQIRAQVARVDAVRVRCESSWRGRRRGPCRNGARCGCVGAHACQWGQFIFRIFRIYGDSGHEPMNWSVHCTQTALRPVSVSKGCWKFIAENNCEACMKGASAMTR